MQPLDWVLVLLPLGMVLAVGLYARSRVKSVADFLSGNRSAGRYLLCIARGELQAGAVVFVAGFETISHSGFVLEWWKWLSGPILLVVGFFGFVTYRYRETRALTLGQFFEIRYSKSFRLFTGLLGFFAGVLNFGIIPGIGARCMVYFLGLPETVSPFSITMPTYIVLMGGFLSVSAFTALTGGLITVMVINCLEGIMAQLFYLVIIFTLVSMFKWQQITTVLLAQLSGHQNSRR
jgi:SSS family solute:Na+ symporter